VPAANLGAGYEQVAFTTSDGLKLKGWYVPSRNGAAVVAFPGRRGPQKQARMLVRHGYGVLLFDRRGEGESDGDPNAFGWAMDRDLKAAAAFLQRRPDVEANRIGGIGLSVGGEMLLQAAAESKVFRAVVSEGAGARSIRENLEKPKTFGGLTELGVSLTLTAGTALFSNHMPPPNLKHLPARIAPRSVFFITHCTEPAARRSSSTRSTTPQRVTEADLGDPGGVAHRGNHRPAEGTRATRDRLLRRRSAQAKRLTGKPHPRATDCRAHPRGRTGLLEVRLNVVLADHPRSVASGR
jgi:hypothetical protein